MPDSLRPRYLAYVDALNERRFADLGEHVAEELTYNGEPMTLAAYQDLLRGDVEAIPDLRYEVDLLVVDDAQVACRLVFDCTPVRRFLGLATPGRRVRFSEHVFYGYRDGRIVAVTSLIDREAIREQTLGPVSPGG